MKYCKSPRILLVTTSNSKHSLAIEKHLIEQGAAVCTIYTDFLNKETFPELTIKQNSHRPVCYKDHEEIFLDSIRSVWWDDIVLPKHNFESIKYQEWARLETQKAIHCILSGLSANYINPPHNILYASNKFLQLRHASDVGFIVPDSLISSKFASVSEFAQTKTVFKPLSRPIPETVGDDRIIYTSVVSREDIEERAIECKLSFFQRYVDKRYELRITVVEDKCFAVEIHSQHSQRTKIDWRRYDIPQTPHYLHNLPQSIADKCVMLTQKFGLKYSTIDMVVTPNGEYVFLELNPQGLWLWIELLTGVNISKAFADLLIRYAINS